MEFQTGNPLVCLESKLFAEDSKSAAWSSPILIILLLEEQLYETYGLTPSLTHTKVLRRYKNFAWLHKRLVDKFGTGIAIPPLPWKLVIGTTGEDVL